MSQFAARFAPSGRPTVRGERRLEEVGDPLVGDEQLRVLRGEAELALVARRARAGQLRGSRRTRSTSAASTTTGGRSGSGK